jgi:hypothetical protein
VFECTWVFPAGSRGKWGNGMTEKAGMKVNRGPGVAPICIITVLKLAYFTTRVRLQYAVF